MNFPKNIKYSKEHQWLEGTTRVAKIGLTQFAVQQLGDIVFIELPQVGDTFQAGDTLGVVESTKVASDIFYPVSGKVVAVNEALVDAPETINADPYGEGWLVQVALDDEAQLNVLMDADAYATLAHA